MDYKGTETFQLLIKNYHATILIDKAGCSNRPKSSQGKDKRAHSD